MSVFQDIEQAYQKFAEDDPVRGRSIQNWLDIAFSRLSGVGPWYSMGKPSKVRQSLLKTIVVLIRAVEALDAVESRGRSGDDDESGVDRSPRSPGPV